MIEHGTTLQRATISVRRLSPIIQRSIKEIEANLTPGINQDSSDEPILDPASLAPVIPVDDLEDAVGKWEVVLGGPPTFVDGERWAQFDLGGRRLALAGTDRATERPAMMLKTTDLDSARRLLEGLGAEVGPAQAGPHERRFLATGLGSVDLIVYAPAGASS